MTSGLATVRPMSCPACRGELEAESCGHCGRTFPDVAGLPDYRRASDRYLSLDDERAKAERLAATAETTDLTGVARAYYAMTPDVDPPRCLRYLRHILGAESRGELVASRLRDEGPILEVGCGTGGLLVAASRRGLTIEGVDIAARWLVVARRRLDDHGLHVPLTAASAERLPWPDGSFATVVADSLIEHCDDPRAVVAEWRRVLRPGGRLVLWSPNRYTIGTDPHVRLWGIGFLPRSWADAYVRLRRGGAWVPRTLPARGIVRIVRESGFRIHSIGPPSIPSDWAARQSTRMRAVIAVYRILAGFAPSRSLLRLLGPVWAIEASR
jgi:SAM-dependent methyltransferase